MNTELFGFPTVNVWVDAIIRLHLIVGLMTLVVMGLIYIERKIIARFQMRLGPTRTGPLGLLQSLADALKLLGKEDLRPRNADPLIFELAVYFVFVPVFMGFVAIPFAFDWNVRVLELGLFYVIAISSVNVSRMCRACRISCSLHRKWKRRTGMPQRSTTVGSISQ